MPESLKHGKEIKKKRKTAIKKSFSGVGEKMSKRADRVAEIILEEPPKEKGAKTKKITSETVSMVKEVAGQIKSNLKEISARDFVNDAAYSIGIMSGAVRKGCVKLTGLFVKKCK